VREVHRVTFAEDRNKYLNADEQLCDGLDFELGLRLTGHRASDDDDVELIPRHSIMKLPKPPRYSLPLNYRGVTSATRSPNVSEKSTIMVYVIHHCSNRKSKLALAENEYITCAVFA